MSNQQDVGIGDTLYNYLNSFSPRDAPIIDCERVVGGPLQFHIAVQYIAIVHNKVLVIYYDEKDVCTHVQITR